jgi:hypothetical protein
VFKNLSNYRITSSVSGKKTFVRNTQLKPAVALASLGSSKSIKTEANFSSMNNFYNVSAYPQGLNVANPSYSNQNFLRFLDGFVNIDDPVLMRRKYRDMYYFDNIAGTAADLRSELPFSEFSLVGVTDPKILQVYEDCLSELRPLQFLRRAMVDYFVYGAFAASFLFDEERKIFLSPRALDLDQCELIQTPLLNDEPIINYKHDEWLKPFYDLYASGDPRAKAYLEKHGLNDINKYMLIKTGDSFKLDPETTLYLERNDLSISPNRQVSYFARALKFYEYEKRIFRGTLDLAEKRLKSILHLTVGSEQIIPQAEDLAEISNAFKTANLDPTDAVVATPWYVQTQEVRSPTDFWRYDEMYDFVSRGKLSALGINEQFLSGEANYNTMDVALSTFLDQLRSDRQYVTDAVFYKKLFPYIARENNFIIEDDKDAIRDMIQESKDIKLNPLVQEKHIQKKIKYQIPSIHWHKSLKPQGDKDYMDLLSSLKDQGIPIPYRMWLAAVGVDAEELMNQYEEEDDILESINNYNAKIEGGGNPENFDFGGDQGETPAEGEGANPFEASFRRPLGVKGRMKLGDLGGEAINEYFSPAESRKGKMRGLSKNERKAYEEKFNRQYAEVLSAKAKQEQQKQNEQFNETKSKTYSYFSSKD